jgi:WD40 repeat protein
MRSVSLLSIAAFISLHAAVAQADDQPAPLVGERAPVLRIEPGGPTARVTGMAFSPDGKTLYVAGLDKVIRVWTRDPHDQQFVPTNAYRVPLGPGVQGALNALALSPDGKWLATGGSGAIRLTAGYREQGLVWVPSREVLSPAMRQDQGTIYVFNTHDGTVHRLRGHDGAIWALSFAQGASGPVLASAAWSWDAEKKEFQCQVHLWDVAAMKPLATAPADALPVSTDPQPVALAAWSTGNDARQTRVAVAAGDGRLRLWNAATNKVASVQDGPRNATALVLPDSRRLVTASLIAEGAAWRGNFRRWNPAQDKLIEESNQQLGAGTTLFWPQALAPVLARDGKRVDYLAAVCLVGRRGENGDQRDYRLVILNAGDLQVVREQRLWDGSAAIQPAVAVGPRGRHLAVAGNPDNSIHVFALDELLDRRRQPRLQVLESAGAVVRQVAWVTKGKSQGLLLRRSDSPIDPEHGPGQKGDWIFAIDKAPELMADSAGWRVVPQAELPEGALKHWREETGIRQVTAAAHLPAGSLLKDRSLLAVGYLDGGEPGLGLYDADSGKQVRELTGHLGPITSLTFTSDGKRLASAAEDQTVSVWDLADLPSLLGKRGTLGGVVVSDRADGKGLVITRVEESSPAQGKLRRGDVLAGLVEKGKLRRFDSVRDFYVALAERPPGQAITLRLGDGNELTLRLTQAIDEHKPLFSVFVTGQRDWIGWSPSGPYEASGKRAENYLGWHIGTDKPDRPTAFGLANQYRKEYETPGALRELLATGKVTPPAPPPPPKPSMTLWIDQPGNLVPDKDARGYLVLTRRAATLRLEVRDFPRDLVDAVSWQLDDGTTESFSKTDGLLWTVDLGAKLAWNRNHHTARAVLRTRGEDPQQYPVEIRFRYQPPPPELRLLAAGGKKIDRSERAMQLDASAAAFPLQLAAAPGLTGEKLQVRLTHQHKDKEASAAKSWDLDNTIEIVARHADAPSGDTAETARLILHVTFEPEPVRVILKFIEPLPVGAGERTDLTGGETVTVHSPRVRIAGQVETKGKPVVEWQKDDGKPQPLQLDGDRSFAVEVPLKAGDQKLTFKAVIEGPNEDSTGVKVRFAPLPPRITLIEPKAVYEGEHQGDLTIHGTLRSPPNGEGYPFSTAILIDGKPLADARPVVDPKAGTFSVRLALKPGAAYRIEARTKNEWEQTSLSNAVLARYWSPPRDIQFDPPPKTVKTPFVELRAVVRSAFKLDRTEAIVESGADGGQYPVRDITLQQLQDKDTWAVVLKNVPLAKGRNVVRLWAANEQGRSRKPGEVAVVYQEPAEPPMIQLLGPAQEEVHARAYRLSFQVRSKAPLQLVEVVRGRKTYPTSQDLKKLTRNSDQFYELKDTLTIDLESGLNQLEIVAVNEGGRSRVPVQVNLVVIPVRLELDALTAEGTTVPLQRQADGAVIVPRAPQPRLALRGRIIWDDANDPILRGHDQWVRVYVNGFQQRPAELLPPETGKSERAFETEILLNRTRDNHIEFALPGLKWGSENRPQVRVEECAGLKPHQWLHLLIVGVGEQDETTLRDEVLKALRAHKEGDGLRTDVFERVKVYGPLTSAVDDLTPEAIQMQLVRMQESMRARGPDGSSDISLIYFKGPELIDDQGHYLLTTPRAAKGARQGVSLSCAELARFFASNRGAQLLFLDVARDAETTHARDQIQEWKDEGSVARVGVFRYGLQAGGRQSPGLDRALAEEMPRAVHLRDVELGLRSRFAELTRQFPKDLRQFPYFYLYPLLDDVVVNRKVSE